MCAFDLLAIVAGKLLLDRESAPSSSNTSANKDQCANVNNTVKKEWQEEEKPSKVEAHDQGSPCRNFVVSELVTQVHEQNRSCKGYPPTQNDLDLGFASAVNTSDCADRFNAEKLLNSKSKSEIRTLASKVEVGFAGYGDFGNYKREGETNRLVKDEPHNSGKVLNGTVANMCSLEDPVVWDGKPPVLISSDSSTKVPLCGNHIPHSSYPTSRDNVNVVSRDDDENSSGCTHPIPTKKLFRPPPRIGDRRIRKILASKYWKIAPRLKDVTLSSTGK